MSVWEDDLGTKKKNHVLSWMFVILYFQRMLTNEHAFKITKPKLSMR
jgi:hypothetical protein